MGLSGQCQALVTFPWRKRHTGDWVDPRASLDGCGNFAPLGFDLWTVQPMENCYTDNDISSHSVPSVAAVVLYWHYWEFWLVKQSEWCWVQSDLCQMECLQLSHLWLDLVIQNETLKHCQVYHTLDWGGSGQACIQEMVSLNPSVAVFLEWSIILVPVGKWTSSGQIVKHESFVKWGRNVPWKW
jgi:hypothetical protein